VQAGKKRASRGQSFPLGPPYSHLIAHVDGDDDTVHPPLYLTWNRAGIKVELGYSWNDSDQPGSCYLKSKAFFLGACASNGVSG